MSRLEFLPTPERRRWLLDELGGLVQRRGYRRFLMGRIYGPTDEDFPDVWSPDVAGVRRLVVRIMRYAGLGRLPVTVRVESSSIGWDVTASDGTPEQWHAAAWFSGLEDYGDKARFGVDPSELTEPDIMVGTLCHEVAHAYRRYHRLEHDDHDVEEQLTDLTTVFMGLGVLTANSSYRYSSDTSGYSHRSGGYLSTQEMCFALAAQLVARGSNPGELTAVRTGLEGNQRGFFSEALKALASKRDELLQGWGAPDLAGIGRSLNAGAPVFGVAVSSQALPLSGIGAAAGLGAGLLLGGSAPLVGVAVAVGATGGWWFGSSRRRYVCSDSDCAVPLRLNDRTCPGCEGSVQGMLRTQAALKEAEARLFAKKGISSSSIADQLNAIAAKVNAAARDQRGSEEN